MIERYLIEASSFADDIDFVINLIAVLTGFWFILCSGVFFYFIFKYRAKAGDTGKAKWVTGEEKVQKSWIFWPHMLVLVCDVFILVAAVRVWNHVKLDMPEETTPIRVVAQQWAWTFVHAGPDGVLDTADDITKIDELYVEKGVTYQYHLSALDVMHDFSVPVFRLKQDAIPGRIIRGWFQPTVAGEFDVQCAEMCGIGHGLMPAKIFVKESADYAAWEAQHAPQLAAVAAVTAASLGE